MDETGGEGRLRTRAKYLVPNNPQPGDTPDYTFDENTASNNFREMHINNVYTVRNFMTRFQALPSSRVTRSHAGIKDVDDCGNRTPFPYNRFDGDLNPLFSALCVIMGILITIVGFINQFLISVFINGLLIPVINAIISVINSILSVVNGIVNAISALFGGSGPANLNVNKLNEVSCISLECPSGSGNEYEPKCTRTPSAGAFTNEDALQDCLRVSLAEALNVFELDFYNDWVNGSLYYPIFKIKERSDGTFKFCDHDKPILSNKINFKGNHV